MSAMRLCRSCAGPVPRASHRCPWCFSEIEALPRRPEHLFASLEGQRRIRQIQAPPDLRGGEER